MSHHNTHCVYCGKPDPDTTDHIPPKCLFPSPRPGNIIKIPSCLSCNRGASSDDEYFKNWLVLRHDVSTHPIGSRLLDSVYRSFGKPEARLMLKSLADTIRHIPVFSPSGLYLGDAPAYDVDLNRMGKVTNRIVRGLFFTEFSRRLPEGYGVRSFAESGLRSLTPDNSILLRKVLEVVSSTACRTIGERVFEYWFQAAPEDPNTTAWLLRFFESESFFCVTAQDTIQSAA
jgi:hypothetical protein